MASKKKYTSLAETLKKNRENAPKNYGVEHDISNYETRLDTAGVDVDEATDKRNPIEKALNLKEDQNVLFDIFEIMGRPQQALFGAIDAAQKGKNVGKAALEGLKGNKQTSGGQLLRNAGIDSDGINGAKEGGLDPRSWGIDDVLGFGLDILADPIDIALLASVPATGGASTPAVAAKFAGDAGQTGKIIKTVSKADDVMDAARAASKVDKAIDTAKTISKVDNAVDAMKVADTASDVTKTRYAIRPFQKGAKSISQVVMEGAGKGIKKAFNLGDTAITKGLGKLDKMELNKLTKKANDAEFTNVDDYLEQFGLKSSDFGRKAEGYKTIKEGFKDTFNQAKTKLGEFRIGQRLAEGQNKLIRDLTAPQIEALDNAASDLAKSRLGADVAEDVLKAEKNKILEDFLNYWESGKDTSIKGRNVLNQIGKGYTFEADKKSVKKLRTLLNNISKRSGQKITYTTEFIDDIRRADLDELTKLTRKKGKAFDEGVERLSEQGLIKKGASVEDVKKKISEIRRGANRLTIDEIGDLKAIKNDPVIQKAFDEAGFKYDLRYTADELDYLEALAKDKDFVNFVESNKNIYQDVNRIIKQATNNQLDFTDIINNSRYARRARGDIGDIDERIKTIDELLQSDDLTDTQKEALNAARKDFEGMKERAQGTTNTWSSRKYNQTALITNRETQEEFSKGIKAIDDQISALENSKYNKKIEDLKAQRAEVKEFQKVIKGKTGDSVRGVAQYQKKVKQLNNVRAKIGKSQENIEYIGKRLDDNIKDLELAITKHDIETIDRALSSKITNDFKRLGKANEQMDALLKEYDNIPYDKMTKQQKYNFDRRSSRISKELEDIEKAIRKDKIMVDSATSKKEVNLMDKSEKAMQKAQDLKTSELGYISKKDALLEKELELSQDIADREARLQTKLEKLNFEIRKTPNEDAIIERKIANLAKTQSVLKSQQTANLFNLNFKAGLEDFIKNAEYTNQSNRLFKDAIMMDAFSEGNVFKKAADLTPAESKNFVALNGQKMAKKLEGIRNLILDDTSTKFSKDALDDVIDTLKNGGTYYADPRIANLFGVATKGSNSTRGMLNLVDWVNTQFKKFSTLTPGFQLRNITGNSFNMFLSGVSPKDIVKYDTQAVGVMNSMPDILKKVSEGAQLTAKEQKSFEIIKQFYEGGFNQAGTAVRDLEKVKQSVQLGGKYNPINKASDLSMRANEYMDGMNRMSLLMYANEHPEYLKRLGAENPIQAVKYALMDPSNMSDVERNVIKKLIPFYTFTKQNLMFQATNMGKNLGRYKKVMKALNKAYDALPDDSYYDYQKDSMQIPLPFSDDNGNQLFLKANLPLSDLGEWMSNPVQRLTASATPLIKVPYEMTTGVDTFTGQESNKPAVERILTGLGLQNISTNLYKKAEAIINAYNGDIDNQQMWAELFRSLVQNVKSENVRQNRLYDELEEYQALVKSLKDEGQSVPTMTEINKTKGYRLDALKRKRANS